jgi:hypothetical protein
MAGKKIYITFMIELPFRKRPVGMFRFRSGDNTKMNFRGTSYEDVNRTGSEHDPLPNFC